MRTRATAPTVTATRSNLLTAARPVNIPGERWNVEGIAYEPHNYGQTGGGNFDPHCGHDDLDLSAGERATLVEWDVWAIKWAEKCEAITPAAVDALPGMALAGLAAHQSHLIEEVLYRFPHEGAEHPNVGLASTAATTLAGGAAVGVVTAFRLLVKHLKDNLKGVRGMIHVPVDAVPVLDFYGLLTVAGNQLLAGSTDHLVVGGSGYSGAGPSGAIPSDGFSWFYATSQVDVRIGPIAPPASRAEIVDVTTNTAEATAWQPVLVSWDRAAHAAVQVCLPDPGPDCGEGS